MALDLSREDHRHPMPSPADVGAAEFVHGHTIAKITGTANALAAFDGDGVGTSRTISVAVSALLDAANNAAIRDAIQVQDGPRPIHLFSYATSDNGVGAVQGLAGFTPSDYAITDKTTVLTLDAIGSVTSVSQTGTIEVLDSSDSVVASLTWTETTPTRKTASIPLPGSAERYRARVSCAGVIDPLTDYALFGGAHIRVTWS